MRKNIKLLIEYDGTDYIGWQSQIKEHGRSIQGVVEASLEKVLRHEVKLTSAGRTDSGVHALGQVANFYTDASIPAERLPLALIGILPDDIVVKEACEVPDDFHARYSAIGKTYRYAICTSSVISAFNWKYSTHLPVKLDAERMQKAADYFMGAHDFSSFCSKGSPVKRFVRTVSESKITVQDGYIYYQVSANGFLYNMVRIMAGTLIRVGRGKWSPEMMPEIIEGKDRNLAGPTAPPQGLMLINVKYPENADNGDS